VDSLGCVNTGCGGVITEGNRELEFSESEIYIYPNPANDYVLLKSARPLDEEHSISLKDITGKDVLHVLCPENSKINLPPLAAGLYFLNIYERGNLISIKKIAVVK
jgi:hypothetical protein